MRTCNKNISPLHRRSIVPIASMMSICGGLTAVTPRIERGHFSTSTYYGIALIAVLPIIGTMIVIARYLSQETDEYMRHLVTQSILWGFGMVMVIDTFLGYVVQSYLPHTAALTALNLEIFLIASAIALRIQMGRNQ